MPAPSSTPGPDPITTPGPDPTTVGRALAALANPDECPDRHSFVDTIADARDAFSDVSTAARFLDAGGEVQLRRAVGAATRADHQCAPEGHALLRDLARLRETLDDCGKSTDNSRKSTDNSRKSTDNSRKSTDNSRKSTDRPEPTRTRVADHFHSGRTTVFSGGGESAGR